MNSTARRTLAAAIFAIAATASATDAQWTAAPLGATSASIATDGTLKYAYARGDYTVNGVAFADEGTDGIDNANCKVDITHDASNTPPADTESGDYKSLLGAGWYASAADRTVTLRDLEAGKRYLVQIIASRSDFTTQSAKAPDGVTSIKFGGEGWEYGGSLIGKFTADATTVSFTVSYAVNSWLNGIQVRELGGGGGGGGETPVFTLTIPAKTGLVLQSVTTNGVAVAAASGNAYSIVSNDTATITFTAASGYEIVSGNPVVLTVTGDKTLADADYPVVQTTGGGGSGGLELGWTVSPMSADGDTICTNGSLVYAYAIQHRTVNTVEFKRGCDNLSVIDENIAVSPVFSSYGEIMARPDGNWSDYGWMLVSAFYWDDAVSETTQTLQLRNLTIGHAYLVQIVSHSGRSEEDGMTISANGTTPQHIGPYGDDETYKYGASIVGTFVATATTENVAVTYSGNSTGLRPINAIQVRDLGEVAPPVVPPSIGAVSAATSGSTAIIALGGVVTGTDDEGVAATSYTVSYSLDGWTTETEKLWNQTGASAWFNITNLADGDYVCSVEIVTDKGGTATNSVAFTVDSASGSAATAWILEPMSASGDTIRTDGDPVYAYSPNRETVNGVAFERNPYLQGASVSFSPKAADPIWSGMMGEGVADGGYAYLLDHAWYWDKPADIVEATITLKDLTPGKNYLVQLVSHNHWSTAMRFAVDGTEPQPVGTMGANEPYKYGASAVGFFTASAPTQTVAVAWTGATGNHVLNAIQVRDLGLAVPVVVEPSIGAVSAAVHDATAVVTLSGVVKGTDDECNPAETYDVSYVLTKDGAVIGAGSPVLEGRTGSTAAFPLANLADGKYECKVTIKTDAGKTSAPKTVSFTIGSASVEWKTEPLTKDGDTISTDGDPVWAYCRGTDGGQLTANGVTFTSYGNLAKLPSGIDLPFTVSNEMGTATMDLASSGWGTEDADGDYAKILDNAFHAAADGDYTFTLTGLEKGRTYLVQLMMHKTGSTATATVPGFDISEHLQFGGAGWTYGGSLVGTFQATGETYQFTVRYDGGFSALNAIQLRDLGVTVATESDPSVESISAKRKGTTATVTLSGVAMGTDENRHPATSYAVSYRLDGGVWTTALPSENGETAAFELAGLEYRNYVCEVKIETNVGKSTAPQSVVLAFTKADGLAIVFFDVENAALAFDMGSEDSVRALLPDASDIYCTVVTSTNLADVVWTPAGPSLAWKANPLPLDDDSGWTWVGVDTTDPVRFYRVALTAAALEEDDEVVFK